jgi:soluble lytic murein transglycosylase-like protein
MKNLRGTYVHRGDAHRRRTRVKQTTLVLSFFGASAFLLGNRKPAAPEAEAAPVTGSSFHLGLGTGHSLSSSIVDVASAEGIDPELGFRLVKLESDFNVHATSPVGAVGLTQVMPSTAQFYVKGITREALYDPNTNLRVGFRYLRGLVKEYKGDVKLALVVYNRGPVAVEKARAEGDNPSNGYDRILTKGYRGKGTVE